MPETPDSDILADPVRRSACPKCGQVVDTSSAAPFAAIQCPQCGTRFSAPGRLGSYVLLKCLGKGAMGATYRALEKGLDRLVAVKVMRSRLGEDDQRVKGFFAEAKAVASLEHPNAVRLYSAGQEKGQPYIVMELIRGRAMDRAFRADKPLAEDRVLEIALGVARALEAAAEIGLVHGDVKPANIMLDEKGTPKLVDFGVARFGGGRAGDEFMGTPYYAAPEQVRREPTDLRTDIYSLGATMFHALTGHPPFRGERIGDVLHARLAGPPPDPRDFVPLLHPKTVAVVLRMMATEPAERHATYRQLLDDLHEAYFQVTGLHTPEMQQVVAKPEIPLAAPVPPSRAWRFVVGGILAAAAVGLGAWALWPGDGGEQPGPGDGATPAGAVHYAASPVFDPPPRAIGEAIDVRIRCETPGAAIRYSTDGSDPTDASPRAPGALRVEPGTTLKARASAPGHRPSAVTAGTYTRDATTLAEVVALRTEANKAWQRVQTLNPGQGFGARLERCDTEHTTAEELYARGAHAAAHAPYARLLAGCKELEKLESQRAAARRAREALLRVARTARGNSSWRRESEAAGTAFIEGRFEEARRLWEQAASKANAAVRVQADRARGEWRDALAKAKPAELRAHAPQAWRYADTAGEKAERAHRDGDYAAAVQYFREAKGLLDNAIKQASEDRPERLRDQYVQRASALLARGQLQQALAEVEKALKAKPDSRSAAELKRRIRSRLTPSLDLGHGRKIALRWIPAGTFVMGSDGESASSAAERPHEVTISKPFYIGVCEVKRREFGVFAEGKEKYQTQAEREKWAYRWHPGRKEWVRATETRWDKPGFDQEEDHPVTCVSWLDADRFCTWAGRKTRRTVRLPTEAEWEYACRAGTTTRFCFGDEDERLHEYGNFADRAAARLVRGDRKQDDREATTARAGRYRPNAWGLHDMHGNVAEWCADRYAPYPAEPVTDPTGGERGSYRVVRGGSWDKLPPYCRSACRTRLVEDYRSGAVGFRIVVEIGND